MSEVEITRCTIQTDDEKIYFNVMYNAVEYNYLKLKIIENGVVLLETPCLFCPCLDAKVHFYEIFDPEMKKMIAEAILEFVKNLSPILDILKKDSGYTGTEFKVY